MVKKIVWNSALILICIGILLTTASGVAAYSLSGYKINNLDGSGIPDWNITVTNGSMQTSTYTNIDGSYNFINLENGTYTVTEELKRGWTNITPLSREITISDQDELNVNFSNEPPQQIVSDDFSAPALNTSLWTPIKPLLDSSTFDILGSGTKDALLSIAVPGGIRHDIWGGVNDAPRIMQKAGDTDFEVEVKFQSPMGSQSQMMGVLVQQDINKYIRFDFDSDGSKTNILAVTFADATFANRTQIIRINTRISGSPSAVPLYMRVKRSGDQWTQSFSTDGMNWNTSVIFTFEMNVTSVGPFAGNSNYIISFTPPHTALIDYFFNTNSRIVLEDVPPAGSKFNISGYKINASDGMGISGWNISIKNGTFETNTFTDSNGYYDFTDLSTGTYTVTEEQRLDWMNLTSISQEVDMIYGDMPNINFTNRPIVPTYNISGYKINASDSTGLSGWNITIRNSTNAEKSTITGSNGFYNFPNIENGTYTVFEELRPEWTNITPLSWNITISGQDNNTVNFTNQRIIHKYNISGFMINASDGKGISGGNISINNLAMQMNTLTDTDGFYEFKNLVNGTYTVIEEADSNWTNITPASREITISGIDKQNVNFTNRPVFIISDDFSASEINTSLWTIINPGGESTITLVGTGTADALLSIAVPGGTAHDILEGKNDAPRIMQKSNNKDFEIEVKFQSELTSEIQIHGVIIEQDANNYIRYSLQTDAAGTKIFANTLANGVTTVEAYDTISGSPSPVPMYMRVKRAGNQWTLSYSSDGVTWNTGAIFTHILKVTSIGPFVGNNGMIAPAYTGLIDYFFNNDSRISQEDIPRFKISGFINNINGSGIEGWNITLSNSTMQISTLTDSHGQYNFGNLVHGTYTIYEEVQRGWTNLTEASRQITISDQNELNVNFTNKPPIAIVSDDFSAPVLNTSLWTFSNPLGDSSYSMSGTGTKNALLSIAVPGGLYNPHDIWNGAINTPRIMQNVSNIDFEIEVKFQSQMNQNAQMLGVIIQQDVNKYVRFDLETNASSTRTVAVTFENATFSNRVQSIKTLGRISGTPSVVPIYMRVKRAGDNWTMFYSSDGTTWNTGVTFKFVLDVRSVGPFVGNSGLPTPANTGVIDYFFNTNSPIIDEDPLKSNISGFKINANNNTGIQGWNITLSNSTMQITKSTGVTGSYDFNDLLNGTYTVSEEQRPGWANTTPISREITIMGQNIPNVNFSNQPIINTYNVSGYNINASDNQGLPGWNITIRNSNIQISKLTGPDGFYEFKYLEDGTYTIFEELQSGWTNTSTASRGLTISGQDIYNVNFTNQKLITKYNVSGFKINSSDGKGISGWNITIMNSTMQVNTVTNASGFYKFSNLLNGTYTILEEKNPDWINVTPASQEITITGKDEQNVNFTNKPLFIISDDFSAPELNTSLWTTFNPLGDSIVTTTGTGTRNALLTISVPQGTEHTIWNGINNVPRVMQNASNRDFGIEAKFQSQVALDTQAQGVIIQEDMNKYLWFNFESDGSNTKIIAGSFADGLSSLKAFNTISISPSAVPMHMRVKRSGNNWIMSYSSDADGKNNWTTGLNINYTLKVSSVGLFVGNRGYMPPAHTGIIDYFFNTESPLLDDLPPAGTKFNVSGYKINASDNTGIEGWNITLKNNSLETSMLTAANGYYNFTGLSSGTYTVTEETRSGWKNITPASRNIEFIYDDIQNINFTNQPIIPTYNISGYKLNASDNLGLSTWNITIKNGTMQISKFTNSNGFYNFNNLVNGTYTVFEEIKPDWRNLSESSREITIQGQDQQNVNFTNQQIVHTYNVSGYKINDNDGTGISDWNITIRNSTNAQISTLTDNNGFYNFTNLPNDIYYVMEENRPGWKNITSLSQPIIVSGNDRQNVNFRNKPLGIVSDDFSDPTLNTSLWTFVDSQNDSSYTIEGTGTSDAVLNINIPAGKSHDLDKMINASWIMQPVSVNDFEVEVKFQSVLNKKIQSQGIVVEQDMNNFLRFDFYTDGAKIFVYAANVTGGIQNYKILPKTIISTVSNNPLPLYMRVKRIGNQWTQNYSLDGINWNNSASFSQTLTVTSVGPYAGNAPATGVTPPAFNGLVDYFFNTASPIANEDPLKFNVSGFKIDDKNANGRWDAGEPGIPDWKISLINDITGLEIANTTTDLSGHYVFHNLTNGTYNVTEESRPYYIATNRTYAVISIAGMGINNLNFTNYIPQNAPIITTQPGNQVVKVGKSATFTVVAQGTMPLSYKWRKNGIIIPGATNPSYTTPPAAMSDNGSTFSVEVNNSLGNAISNSPKLTVKNIVSDDFDTANLDSSTWTFINPRGDASYSMVGTGTENATIQITIPSGTSHDVYTGGNWAPRIMQTADNTDFEIETKFMSLMTKNAQMQGLIIEQDSNNYLRFDFARTTTTTIYAIKIIGGTGSIIQSVTIPSGNPLYMRINRTGNNWKEFYSYNGTNDSWIEAASFNLPLVVSSVGPFIGNGGSTPPATTGLIDYFFNTSSPRVPEDEVIPDTTGPSITLWYGKNQSFGQIGVPQQWMNILGNVQDASGISSLNYSLNNGNVTNLSIGPDTRLESSGDFNVEINRNDLLCGNNQLVITAADPLGNSRNENVLVNYSCNNVWPLPYSINWSNSASIQNVSQIVDGLWIKEANSIRPAVIGYDRLVDIGDLTWKDYEITAPITINTLGSSSLGPNLGVIMRWQGHWDWRSGLPSEWQFKQPRPAWHPLGALGVYIWVPALNDYRLRIIGNNMALIANDTSGKHLDVGVPYIFKMSARTNGTRTLYSLKVWQKNQSETTAVTISGYGPTGELKQGSVLLAANYANVSFGDVSIRPLYDSPDISEISVEAHEYNATVNWITSKPASGSVSYGLSTGYELGTVSNGTMAISHSILLDTLQPGTTYHYQINSSDIGGNYTNTTDLTFITKNLMAPNITTQPVNKTAINGSTAIFSVSASGTAPLSYQWMLNGVIIPGATGPSYTTPIVTLADSGTKYSVLVRNDHGSVTSNEVTLTVIEQPPVTWWDTSRSFRVPVTIDPAGFERYEKPVDVSMNFTQVLGLLGQAGALDETSLRVVETDINGVVLSDTVPFQFDKDTGFNAVTKASGTVVFIMNGTTPANAKRYYQVYFGLTGGSYSTQSVTPKVTIDTVTDEGQSSFRVAANGSTYYFQKQGGGFSSLVDSSGNDWISYAPIVGSAEFRGVPNVASGGIFHPGFTCCTSSIVTQGPLKIRVRSVSPDGKWESLWDFYPGYATMTMVKAVGKYFFLYEGTPGGIMEPDKDFMVRSDNSKTLLSEKWTGDLATQEWAYFSDPTVDKSLFAAHHEDDIIQDQYWPYKTNVLTVFGFGRSDVPNATGLIPFVPQRFTIGLMNGTGFAQNARTVYSAYKDVGITKGAIEQYDSVRLPGIVTQPAGSIVVPGVSSTFSVSATGQLPLSYQWQKNGMDIPGATNASYTTSPAIAEDNGSIYQVVVTNVIGVVTSDPVKQTVISGYSNKQLVVLDVNYEHNTVITKVPYSLGYATSGKSSSFFNFPSYVPSNFKSPIDYAHGTLYQRLEVLTKPSSKIAKYQICLFQTNINTSQHACSDRNTLAFTSTGTYYAVEPMTSIYQYSNLNWSSKLLIMMLDITDKNGVLIDDRVAYNFNKTWDGGNTNLGLYYPMQVRYTAIIVPPGGGAPIWPPNTPPGITTQPANQTTIIGDTATFSVAAAATGTEQFHYQWQKNGVNIDGAYSSSYTIPIATAADNGSVFRVVVSNSLGSVTSNEAVLKLVPAINLIQNPGFESGTSTVLTNWVKYQLNGGATLNKATPGIEGTYAAKLAITSVGTNPDIQLYQTLVPLEEGRYLEPNTSYRLSFAAYSSTGHDLTVKLVKASSLATSYGLTYTANLNTSWQVFTTEFNTANFTSKTKDGRLQFRLAPFAKVGDSYFIDNVSLVKVIAAPDTTPPSVTGKTPTGINIPYTMQITVNFSEAMNKTSAESAFSTMPGTTGSFSWNGNSMVYTPVSLEYGTKYNVTIGTGAKDLADNNLSSIFEWNFTTMEQDRARPTVSGNSPTGTGVLLTAKITVNFSEAMNQSSVRSAFSTIPATTGSFAWTGNNLTYTPSNLAYNTTYNVTVGTGAMDLAGNNMLLPYYWEFTTIPDMIPPSVTGNTPVGTNVANSSVITVTFNEAMNNDSVESAFSTIPATTGNFSWIGNTMTYTPDSLNYSTAYNVTIGTNATDLAGNNLTSLYEWQFTTRTPSVNMLSNPGFESGISPWTKSTNGVITFSAAAPGYEGSYAGKIAISTIGSNMQIYRALTLEPNTRYRLSFAAYSTTGHDMAAKLILGYSPYSTIGSAYTANLNTSWQTYTTEFNNAGTVTNARLQFFFAGTGMAAAGDTYYIDNVVLEKVI